MYAYRAFLDRAHLNNRILELCASLLLGKPEFGLWQGKPPPNPHTAVIQNSDMFSTLGLRILGKYENQARRWQDFKITSQAKKSY